MISKKILPSACIVALSLMSIPSIFAATDGDFRLLRSDVVRSYRPSRGLLRLDRARSVLASTETPDGREVSHSFGVNGCEATTGGL